VPSRHVRVPSRHVRVPSRHVRVPSRHVQVPPRHVRVQHRRAPCWMPRSAPPPASPEPGTSPVKAVAKAVSGLTSGVPDCADSAIRFDFDACASCRPDATLRSVAFDHRRTDQPPPPAENPSPHSRTLSTSRALTPALVIFFSSVLPSLLALARSRSLFPPSPGPSHSRACTLRAASQSQAGPTCA
jgi:hypothetical protein